VSGDIAILPLGGCLVEFPLGARAARRGEVRARVGAGGRTPVTHSLGDMVQFVRLLRGEIEMPAEARIFAGISPAFRPAPGAGDLAGVDVALVEPNTPVDIVFEGSRLQRNAIIRRILDPIRAAHPDPETKALVGAWFIDGLMECDDPARIGFGRRLAELVPADLPRAQTARNILTGARGERGGVFEQLGALLERIETPVGLVSYVYQYMADGRPTSWPIGFRADVLHAARAFDLPVFEPWELVESFGFQAALSRDLRHYSPAFMLPLADALVGFAAEVKRRGRRPVAAAAKPSLPPTELAARVNAELIEAQTLRIAELGRDRSGLFAHYEARLLRGAVIGVRERAICELIETWLPPYARIDVIRAGVGELALPLAAGGAQVRALEPHPWRRAAIAAGAAHLAAAGLLAEGRIEVVDALVEEAPPAGRALAVALDAMSVRSEEEAAPLMRRLSAYAGLLVDLRMLFALRDEEAERERALELLCGFGFVLKMRCQAEAVVWLERPAVLEPPRSL
jgi:hypothetical protein